MRRSNAPARALLLLSTAAFGALPGCGNGLKAGQPDSPTRGVALEVFRTDGRSSHAYYEIEPDGTLSFAGGMDALDQRPTWSMPLTREQIESLHALLVEHGWFDTPPEDAQPAEAEDEFECRVSFASPQNVWRTTVAADNPRMEPVVEFLRELSLARHEQLLQSLPQPSQPAADDE